MHTTNSRSVADGVSLTVGESKLVPAEAYEFE